MKKLIFAILSIFVVAVAGAQNYPVTQNLGNTPNTLVQTNSIRAGQGIILGSFTDTAAANALPYLKNYTGAAIWCTADSSIYVRQKSSTAAFWFKIGGAGGGSTGSFWNLTGNTIAAVPAGFGIGTNSADNLPLKTDNTTRVILPSTGLARQSGGAWTTMMFDTTNKTWGYGNGYTPTLQQVMGTEGNYSVLTSTSDISPSSGSYDFFIGDDLRWRDIELRGDRKIELNNLISNLSIGDSIMINPYTGIINIDSLRTWSGISDTTYKKPMTWDTRNGRWEYAANWYGSGASTIPLSSITAATASNTINNGNYTQEWQWNTKDSYGLKLTANTTADGDNQALLSVQLSGNNATSNITSYGLTASNSHTGTNSTNIGGFSYAGGGTTNIGLRTVATGGTTNIALDLGQSGSYLGNMRMNGNTSGSITIQPAAAAGTYTLTLPTTDGNSGQFIQTDGSGVLTFADAMGGGGIGLFEDSIVNVRDYGAVGDGTTEDSTAFKNAIATGRPVFVPKGTYKMTATLRLNTRQYIFGTGNTSIIYTTASRTIIKTADSCTIKDLSFRGSGMSTLPGNTDTLTQNGVWVNGSNNKVTGCSFIKMSGRGVWIHSPTITNMEGNLITDNTADSNTVAFASSFGSNYSLFANNTARYNLYGYYEFSAANMTNNSNIYQGNTNAMYFASGDLRGSIVNCQLNHSTVTFTQGNTYGMIISDCSFFNTNVNIGTVDTVKFLNFNNSRFVGCTITATRADSCQVFGGRFMQTVTVTGQGIKFHNVIGTANSVNQFWGGIGLADSSFHTKEGLSIGRGIYAPNLPTGKKAKQLYWENGIIYIGDSTGTGSGGGSSGWGLTGNTLGAYGSYIGINDSYDLRFFTNSTERMRIDSSLGSVGIGVAPQTDYLLTVKSNASVTGGVKITSDQTYPIFLRFHNDAFGNMAYFNTAFGRIQFIIDNSSYDYQITQGANVIQTYDVNNGAYMSRRSQEKQGADVASAAGAITLGGDGNVFEITGTSAITAINNTNWQNGATVTLLFTSTASLTHGTANSGTSIGFELAGAANFNGTAGDVVVLVLSEIGGTQRWRMVSASVN